MKTSRQRAVVWTIQSRTFGQVSRSHTSASRSTAMILSQFSGWGFHCIPKPNSFSISSLCSRSCSSDSSATVLCRYTRTPIAAQVHFSLLSSVGETRCGLTGIAAQVHSTAFSALLAACCGLTGIAARVHCSTARCSAHRRCGLKGIAARVHSAPCNALRCRGLRHDGRSEKGQLLRCRLGLTPFSAFEDDHFPKLLVSDGHQPDLSLGRKPNTNAPAEGSAPFLGRTVSRVNGELEHLEAFCKQRFPKPRIGPSGFLRVHRQIEHRKEPHGLILRWAVTPGRHIRSPAKPVSANHPAERPPRKRLSGPAC